MRVELTKLIKLHVKREGVVVAEKKIQIQAIMRKKEG